MDNQSYLWGIGVEERLFQLHVNGWLEASFPSTTAEHLDPIVTELLSNETGPRIQSAFSHLRDCLSLDTSKISFSEALQTFASTVQRELQATSVRSRHKQSEIDQIKWFQAIHFESDHCNSHELADGGAVLALSSSGGAPSLTPGSAIVSLRPYSSSLTLEPAVKSEDVHPDHSKGYWDTDYASNGDTELKRRITIGANETMAQDPCRRFCFGITFDCFMVFFWRFDRSKVVVSDPFDFEKSPELLVRLMLALLLSSKAELGFDPTVERLGALDPAQDPWFVYHLGNRRYRTIGQPIHDHLAGVLCSRAVRVWLVREIDGDDSWVGGEHALKDFWADEGQVSDTACQRAIMDKLRVLDRDGGHRAQEMKKFFLRIRHDEEVVINGAADSTLTLPDDSIHQPQFYWTEDDFLEDFYSSEPPRLPISSWQFRGGRHHRRLLIEEKCCRLTNLSDMTQIFGCLKQFSHGLDLFRQAGHVHRDVSTGNLLVHEANGVLQGKISDLEFCKEYASISRKDPAVGTFEFIATEALGKKYRFPPLAVDTYLAHKFQYHFFYDLEALYWVLVWIILTKTPSSSSKSPVNDALRREWAEEFEMLFPHGRRVLKPQPAKRVFLNRDEERFTWRRILAGMGWAGGFVFQPIFDYRKVFIDAYAALQGTAQDPDTHLWSPTCFSGDVYAQFASMIDKAIEALPKELAIVRPIHDKVAPYHLYSSASL